MFVCPNWKLLGLLGSSVTVSLPSLQREHARRYNAHRQLKNNSCCSQGRSTGVERIVALNGNWSEDRRDILDQPCNKEFPNISAPTGCDTSPLGEVMGSCLADVAEVDESSLERLRCCDRNSCCMLDQMENELASKLSWSTDMELVDAYDDEEGAKEQNQQDAHTGEEASSPLSPASAKRKTSKGRRKITVTSPPATVDSDIIEQRRDMDSWMTARHRGQVDQKPRPPSRVAPCHAAGELCEAPRSR